MKEMCLDKLVSIIIPAYNAEQFIMRSIRSALNQSYQNVEVIIVENGSTDNTQDVLLSIQDERVRIFHSSKGVSNARNVGIEKAQGEYLFFLDADDWLESDAVEKMVSAADEEIDLISTRYFLDKPFETYTEKIYDAGSEEYLIKCLFTPTKRGNATGNLYRKDFLVNNNILFPTDISNAEDSVFFINCLMHKPVVKDLEIPTYHVYLNPSSATRDHGTDKIASLEKATAEVYRLLEGSSKQVINAGYIFAMNQILVILAHAGSSLFDSLRITRSIYKIDVFSHAINKSDIKDVSLVKRISFFFMKQKMYFLLSLMMWIRKRMKELKSGEE